VTFVTGKQVGGINATDALQVNNWGLAPNSIEKVRWYAGDVQWKMASSTAGDAGESSTTSSSPVRSGWLPTNGTSGMPVI
jgi:hypothetical protein